MKGEVLVNIKGYLPQHVINLFGEIKTDSNQEQPVILAFDFSHEDNKSSEKSNNTIVDEYNYIENGEFPEGRIYIEGSQKTILVNAYERDPKKRNDCIKKYGVTCSICGFNFSDNYGDRGMDFIEVHHITPLYKINEYYSNTVDDLRPVCSNCHSMIHRFRDDMTIEELNEIYKTNKNKNLL